MGGLLVIAALFLGEKKKKVAFTLSFWNLLLHPCVSCWPSCPWESLNDLLHTVSTCSRPLGQGSLWLSSALPVTATCLALPLPPKTELKPHLSSAKGSASIFCISLHFKHALPIMPHKRSKSVGLQLFLYLESWVRLNDACRRPLSVTRWLWAHFIVDLNTAALPCGPALYQQPLLSRALWDPWCFPVVCRGLTLWTAGFREHTCPAG